MTVLCVGVDHSSAPLALRERLAFAAASGDRALDAAAEAMPLIDECALLSTCNRVEFYASAAGDPATVRDCAAQLASFIARQKGVPLYDVASALRYYEGGAAEQHLCRVASGLESLVIGETEILGQVTDALARAQRLRTARATLTALFETAIRAGKRSRLETALGHNPASISSVAVALAEELAPKPTGNRALFIGAGKMGRIGVTRLCASGRWFVSVTSRTPQHAETLAANREVTPVPFEALDEALANADVVFTATSADTPIVDLAIVRRALGMRLQRPLVFIDVAVPRNVNPDVRVLEGVSLYDVDDLRSRVEVSLQQRRAEVPAVESIIAEELSALHQRARGAELLRLVQEWRQGVEETRRREVGRVLERLPQLTPELSQHLEHLSVSLVSRLLDEPTRRLRAEASNGHAEEFAVLARRLFLPDHGPRVAP